MVAVVVMAVADGVVDGVASANCLAAGMDLSCQVCVLGCNPVGLRLIDPGLERAASGMMGAKNWMLSVVVAWYDDFYDLFPYHSSHPQTHSDHRRHHFVDRDPRDAVHRVAQRSEKYHATAA